MLKLSGEIKNAWNSGNTPEGHNIP